MQLKLVALLILQFGISMQNWCGYQPSWRQSDDEGRLLESTDRTLTYLYQKEVEYERPIKIISTNGLDLETGIFTAPTTKSYLVTLTALLSGLGYHETKGSLSSYAQLFILKNGKLQSLANYLLVEQGKVGDLRMEVDLYAGDTLQVFVGHHVNDKTRYGRNSGYRETVQSFELQDVRFCIF